MISSIKVYSLEEAKKIASSHTNGYNAWITAIDPESNKDVEYLKSNLKAKGALYLDVYFRDYLDNGKADYDNNGPRHKHVKEIISFFKLMKNDVQDRHVGVNCFAGVSRSAAIALIGWMIHGYNSQIALEKVLAVRTFCYPSNRILRLYDEITGSNTLAELSDFYESKKIII